MIGIYWFSDIALSSASAAIACVVFAFYLSQLLKSRSKFTYGLALLSGSLFAESLLTSFMYLKFSSEYGAELAIPLMGMTVLTLVALASFAYVVRQREGAGAALEFSVQTMVAKLARALRACAVLRVTKCLQKSSVEVLYFRFSSSRVAWGLIARCSRGQLCWSHLPDLVDDQPCPARGVVLVRQGLVYVEQRSRSPWPSYL